MNIYGLKWGLSLVLNCWFCGARMCWGNDFNFEDFGIEDENNEGVVSTYNCTNEECGTYVEWYVGLNRIND